MQPKGILLDYGGTLVEEISYDERAAHEWLLTNAAELPPSVSLDDVLERVDRLARELGSKHDDNRVEVPWQSLTRLAYDSLGIRLDAALSDFELGYWSATARTRAMPGASAALEALQHHGVAMAVVSNCRFSEPVLRHELERHDLARHLAFIMVSAEYAARKPSPALFEAAAQRLGVCSEDIWFIGDRLDTDIAGAKAAGMKTLWFRGDGGADAPANAADHSTASWSEVVSYFDRLWA